VWEETPEGWIRIDFFDSLYLAQSAYPEATVEPLPPSLITDQERAKSKRTGSGNGFHR
jgi:hypothetical protein